MIQQRLTRCKVHRKEKKEHQVKLNTRTILSLLALLALVAGCMQVTTDELMSEERAIELAAADMIDADITMGAGQLTIGGGADPETALFADFTYNIEDLRPQVDYNVAGDGTGQLNVQQPDTVAGPFGEDLQYDWNLQFNEQVPIDLSVNLGAGESTLDLGSLDLAGLDMDIGAGDVIIDLRNVTTGIDASIDGGVGRLQVQLPHDIGVRVEVNGALGEVVVNGLTEQGGAYVNEAYDSTAETLNLTINGGVGQVQLDG